VECVLYFSKIATEENEMSNEDFLTKALTDTAVNRRTFLKWSGALGGTAVLAGGLNYGFKQVSATETANSAGQRAAPEGEWVTAACWHNCGGRCVNKAYVVDGVMLRQKTDDTHPDTPDFPQQRGCARGRSQQWQVFGADRLKYPMKRKNWEPGGGKRELRGKDEWERISWDEALDLVANELKRIKETHGNESILTPTFVMSNLLYAYGGAMNTWGVSSEGAWPAVRELMAGGLTGTNDRLDYRNSKLIVLWASNPIWSSAGNPTYNYLQAKKAGAKFIFVDPYYNDSAQALADEWIPVRPGTDAALLIGMAYYMIENNLQDQEFLDKYTVGFDADHMPEGVDPKENFKDYVLGTYDGIPKTPEWASEICGTHPRMIRQFAHEIATTKPLIFSSTWAPARTYYGQQFCQAFLTVGWMTGNVGISGGGVCESGHAIASHGGPPLVRAGGTGTPFVPNPLAGSSFYVGYGFANPTATDFSGMAYEEMWDAILKGEYTATVRGKVPCDIRLIWGIRGGSGANSLNQSAGVNKGIEAFRKVEFVVTNDIVLSTFSKYADIVLPATTLWERYGSVIGANREIGFIWSSQITEPLYEAKDDIWVAAEIGRRLGLDPTEIDPVPLKQQVFNQIAGARVMKDEVPNSRSEYEPLVTITAQDIAELGVEGEPQQGRITWKELKEKGFYQVPRSPGDNYEYIALKEFREDPEANPLPNESGKIEIHSQRLADIIESRGWSTIQPIPAYNPSHEGYEATYADWQRKVKGDYPLQCFNIHYLRRSHTVFDNIPQLRRAFPHEFFMNSLDAEERGIKHGDIVLITSRHGESIRPVCVTPRMMPGVVTLPHGAWVEIDEETGIDKAGSDNYLCGAISTGQGVSGWNSLNVQVEKYDGPIDLKPDYMWSQRIPLKEA
jgi:anaerobic dimethyl sulfoxide reductase subunit A